MGNKLNNAAESYGRKASPNLRSKQVDKLKVILSDLIEIVAQRTILFFTCNKELVKSI